MKLKILNSNSSGNCYILGDDNHSLLIECGLPFAKIKEDLGYNLIKVDACLCTHQHKDHSKAFNDVMMSGIHILSGRETFSACAENPAQPVGGYIPIDHGHTRAIGEWVISALSVPHDVPTLCFIIEHPECGIVLFVTDTYVLKYKFPYSFDHVIIEANYDQEIVDDILLEKEIDFVYNRRLTSHMSFQTTLRTLDAMDLSSCKNIVLIHLSDGFTDEKKFKEVTEKKFGIKTTIAAPGVEINFNKNPF